MRAGPVLAVSTLAHALALGLLTLVHHPVARPLAPPMPVVTIEPAPIEVEIVQEPRASGVGAPGSAPHRASSRSPSTSSSASSSRFPLLSSVAPSHSSLALSGGPKPEARGPSSGPSSFIGVPGVLDRIASSPSAPAPPDAPRISGKLDNAPNGTGVIHDKVTTVTVERDGSAHFHDKPDFTFHLRVPIPTIASLEESARAMGEAINEWSKDPDAYVGTRAGPKSELPEFSQAVPGQCDTWGEINCGPPPPMFQHKGDDADDSSSGGLGGGKADLTSYLAKKFHVGDQYASRKRALLDDTRDERAARGGAFRAEQLARSAELMHRNLELLWRTTPDPAARRRALFELWDECGEGDGPLGEAGERARAEVIGWIRAHRVSYPPDELAALASTRASTQEFAP